MSKRENPNNVRMFCSDCSPAPKLYSGILRDLVGGYVKVGFPAFENEGIEHMWVGVVAAGDNEVYGKLDNEPFYTDFVQLGDAVTVTRDAIEDWHERNCKCAICGRPVEK